MVMLVDLGVFAAICCIVGSAVVTIRERRHSIRREHHRPWYQKRRA
jgi:hypothetical protein